MEIKVQCPCGTKYKFDVEPIHGRMPAPVNCPACGADGTALANDYLRQNAPAPAPVPIAPIPVAASVPVATAAPRATAAPAPTPVAAPSLSIATPTAPPPPSGGVVSPAYSPVPQAAASKGKNRLATIGIILLALLVFGYGLYRTGSKWSRRFKAFSDLASAISDASKQAAKGGPQNLTEDDCVILFIKHTNHTDVANACKTCWNEQFHKKLTITESFDDADQRGHYSVIAAHNGFVRIMATRDWEPEQFETVAKDLSQKLNTLVFEMTSEHVADTYHFGAYEQGTRKFHAQMDVKITKDDMDEIVTTDGNDWAIANGYKPGPDGFKSFDLTDADKITQHLGMKFWDEKEDAPAPATLFLSEEVDPAKNNQASPAPAQPNTKIKPRPK